MSAGRATSEGDHGETRANARLDAAFVLRIHHAGINNEEVDSVRMLTRHLLSRGLGSHSAFDAIIGIESVHMTSVQIVMMLARDATGAWAVLATGAGPILPGPWPPRRISQASARTDLERRAVIHVELDQLQSVAVLLLQLRQTRRLLRSPRRRHYNIARPQNLCRKHSVLGWSANRRISTDGHVQHL